MSRACSTSLVGKQMRRRYLQLSSIVGRFLTSSSTIAGLINHERSLTCQRPEVLTLDWMTVGIVGAIFGRTLMSGCRLRLHLDRQRHLLGQTYRYPWPLSHVEFQFANAPTLQKRQLPMAIDVILDRDEFEPGSGSIRRAISIQAQR